MKELRTHHHADVTSSQKEVVLTPAPVSQDRPKRTPGLWTFDALLYPLFTNLSVFLISVGATYLTARGGDKNAAGKLKYGKIGQFMQKRGDWLMEKLKTTGMSHAQADMSKMVVFSFLDGSLMAPVVKLFEDRREKFGKALDNLFGTTPPDDAPYKAEPKQSWGSVLGGRFVTAAIVVPTAVALDRIKVFDQVLNTKIPLNDKLFNNPGEKFGAKLEKVPAIAKIFRGHDVKELTRIAAFEAFYTTVCTAGLYLSSRTFARWLDAKKDARENFASDNLPTTPFVPPLSPQNHSIENQKEPIATSAPLTHVSEAHLASRLAPPLQEKLAGV